MGLRKFAKLFRTKKVSGGIYTFNFDEEDVMRSELVKFIVSKLKGI